MNTISEMKVGKALALREDDPRRQARADNSIRPSLGLTMPKDSVAVVLTTFNGEKFVLEQLNSIRQQTRMPDELLIFDDRSTDQTTRIVEAFLHDYPGMYRLAVNIENNGFAANFRQAIAQTTAEWVVLCDQDDYWVPQKIETLLSLVHESNLVLLIHNLIFCDCNLDPLAGSLEQRLDRVGKTSEQFCKGCCMIAQGDFARFCMQHLPAGLGHDNWLNWCALHLKRRAYSAESVLIKHRGHTGQASGWLTGPIDGEPFSPWKRIWEILRIAKRRLRFKSTAFRESVYRELAAAQSLLLVSRRFGSEADQRRSMESLSVAQERYRIVSRSTTQWELPLRLALFLKANQTRLESVRDTVYPVSRADS